jgi:thioredoxin-dependent peroxiredoxin
MTKIAVGKKIPSFSVMQSDGAMWKSADALGKNLVLYFYPKDMTSGCTIESQDFRDLSAAFKKAQTQVLGVSRDSCASHVKFRAKEKLPFELLADTDEKLCKLFDVIKEKNMYGKKVMGIERSTFLFDAKGVLIREWRKVKVDGHAAEVLATVQAL